MANDQIHTRPCESITNPALRDDPILDAWGRRQAAWAQYEALPFAETPEQRALEERDQADIDAAEETIRGEVATTLRGVEIQLWISVSYAPDAGNRNVSTLVEREDLASLWAQEERFDYSMRMSLAALRSLKSMGA